MTARVRRTFYALVVVAVLATGAVSEALRAGPGRAAGLAVAVASVTVVTATSLALRILLVAGGGPCHGGPARRE